MKRKITRNGGGEEKNPRRREIGKVESGPTSPRLTRLQAQKQRAPLATPLKQPPATSSANRSKKNDVVNQNREKRCKLSKDPSPPLACCDSASSRYSNCQGTTSPTTDQSLRSVELSDDMELGESSAKTPAQAFPHPSISSVKASEFAIPDSSFRPASGDVQVEEPRGVGRTETAANTSPHLWCAATCRENFLELTGHEAHNPNAPSSVSIKQQPVLETNETAATSDIAADRTKEGPWTHTSAVGNISASATDKPIVMTNATAGGQSPTTRVAATEGFCPTSVSEKVKLSPEFIEDQLGACSGHHGQHDIPGPSSSSVIAPRFLSPDSTFRPVPGDVQVAEPRGVGTTETTTYRKNFPQLSHKACIPNTPSPVGNLSAFAEDKPVAVTDGFCPTSVAENAKMSSEFIEHQPGACSGHPDLRNIPGPTCSLGLTDFVNMMDGNDLGEEDVESAALVTVQNYKVKPSSKATLDLIFQKYGDIAENFTLELSENRSLVLDEVCQIIQSFEGKTLKDVTQFELQREVERLRWWNRSGLDILWLLERLEGALEAKQLLQQSSALKDESDTRAEAFNRKKRELGELAQKKIFFLKEIEKIRLAEQALKQELEATEAELKKTKEKVSKAKGKISPYVVRPILDKLL